MRRRPYNVLVFDDDQTALHQLVTLLQQRDYVVKGTSSAEEARWWLSLRPIDLLIAAVWIVFAAQSARLDLSAPMLTRCWKRLRQRMAQSSKY